MDIRLNGRQYQALMKALLKAYPAPQPLQRMLRFQFNKNLYEISIGPDMQTMVFEVISTSQAEGWTARLINAARIDRPDNDAMRMVAEQLGLTPFDAPKPVLERLVAKSSRFIDAATFFGRGSAIEGQVCRVEVPVGPGQKVLGTGFLVGPSAVLTNYHVVEAAIKGEKGETTAKGLAAKPSDIVLRFDFKRTRDGQTIDPGIEYKLAGQWLIDASPPSPVDGLIDPGQQLPDPEQLDYALLRLDSPAGNHILGRKAEPGTGPEDMGAPLRNWINLPSQMPDIVEDKTVLIMQHPEGQPLKLALGSDAITGLNDNGTRLRYTTSTEGGSSGSPVFNIQWELIALHHLGDPNFAHNAEWNQGIPVTTIRALLEQRDKLAELEAM